MDELRTFAVAQPPYSICAASQSLSEPALTLRRHNCHPSHNSHTSYPLLHLRTPQNHQNSLISHFSQIILQTNFWPPIPIPANLTARMLMKILSILAAALFIANTAAQSTSSTRAPA